MQRCVGEAVPAQTRATPDMHQESSCLPFGGSMLAALLQPWVEGLVTADGKGRLPHNRLGPTPLHSAAPRPVDCGSQRPAWQRRSLLHATHRVSRVEHQRTRDSLSVRGDHHRSARSVSVRLVASLTALAVVPSCALVSKASPAAACIESTVRQCCIANGSVTCQAIATHSKQASRRASTYTRLSVTRGGALRAMGHVARGDARRSWATHVQAA